MSVSGIPVIPQNGVLQNVLHTMEKYPCPRCEVEWEIFSPEKLASLAAEIKIDPSLAAEKELYEKRLETCVGCESLRVQVMCAHCGCFIIFRARPAKSYCPHPNGDRWVNYNLI
jgi:hypothetical protein